MEENGKKSFWTREVKYRSGDVENVANWPNIIKFSVGMFLLLIVLLVGCPAKIVGPTERGVVKTFGEVKERILEPGLHFKIPFAQKITTYDLTPNTIKVNIPVGDDGAVTADRQTIGAKGSVDWKYDDVEVLRIAKAYSSKEALASQTRNIIITAIKNTLGQHNIALIVKDQVLISNQARDLATQMLTRAGIPVVITALNLDNWDWTEDYDRMVRSTVEMDQNAIRAEAELKMIEQQAQQQVRRAQAEAESNAAAADGRRRAAELDAAAAVAKAQGESDARRIEGQGIAEYNRLIAQNMSVQVRLKELEIELERAKRWDGRQVPTYVPLNPAGGIVTLPVPGK